MNSFAGSGVGGRHLRGTAGRSFRLWIASYSNWQPASWHDVPPQATALELIEDVSFTEEEARLFLEGFNSQMLAVPRALWAVAVSVRIRFDGDAEPGQVLHGYAFDPPSPATALECGAVGGTVGGTAE